MGNLFYPFGGGIPLFEDLYEDEPLDRDIILESVYVRK
jgi:hypothetical protein